MSAFTQVLKVEMLEGRTVIRNGDTTIPVSIHNCGEGDANIVRIKYQGKDSSELARRLDSHTYVTSR